jgi:GTP-binding protein
MLIDEVNLKIKGGDGGNGLMSYKNALMEKGPTGGDGGRGGDAYVIGVSDLSALRQFRHKKNFSAGRGGDGSNRNKDGANGQDLVLEVPIGTVVRNLDLHEEHEVTAVNQKILVAHGAAGGYGNFHFRSSTNITPRLATPGHKAREFNISFELKLIADVGFVGLPNAGKSALLNELTAAKSRVANYPFTTLEPNLGAYYDLILADIPGLIEGASAGKGLGDKFLRHISRCRVLFHLLSAESTDLAKDYQVIRQELEQYDPALGKKPEYLFLSKTDVISEAEVTKKSKILKKLNPRFFSISVFDEESLNAVKKILNQIAKEKIAPAKDE